MPHFRTWDINHYVPVADSHDQPQTNAVPATDTFAATGPTVAEVGLLLPAVQAAREAARAAAEPEPAFDFVSADGGAESLQIELTPVLVSNFDFHGHGTVDTLPGAADDAFGAIPDMYVDAFDFIA